MIPGASRASTFTSLFVSIVLATTLTATEVAPESTGPTSVRLDFPELRAPVRIATDRGGIPHLRASNLSDLYFAWGFVTARDRLWQIELSRRSGQGRLWEWFGNRALRGDGGAQLFEFSPRARRDWERERRDPVIAMPLERFAEGVNAYVALCRKGQRPWPVELGRLGKRPEDWRPEDAYLLLYGMGVLLDLDIPEVAETETLRVRGRGWYERRRRFESDYAYTSIPDSAAERMYGRGRTARPSAGGNAGGRVGWRAPGLSYGRDPDQRASDIFAVGPGRATRGVALLANDVHLSLTSPSPLYALHVTVPDTVDAAGASVPGLPIIVSGRNRRCAWGITALSADVIDLYADTLSSDGRRVRHRGTWAAVREGPYTMRFRFWGIPLPTFGQKRRYTPHGPVVGLDKKRRIAYSARWAALEHPMTLRELLGLERSVDAAEVARRARSLVTPALNIVSADRDGRVRYQTVGAVPRRSFEPGRGALPADPRHEWLGRIPPEFMPAWDVPRRGFVANGNNLPVGRAYPEVLPRYDWVHDRAARLAQRLGGDASITLADMRSVQNDVFSRAAERLLPLLLRHAEGEASRLSPRARAALDTLRSWDRRAVRTSVATSLFRTWFGWFNRRTGLGDAQGLAVATLDGRATQELGAPSGGPERVSTAVTASLDSALATLERFFGSDPKQWVWGRAHRGRFRHALAWLDPSLQPVPFPMDGDNSTPSVGASHLPTSVHVTHGPAWRHLVDLAEPDSSLCVNPPGNATGRHTWDHLQRWASHGYVPLYLSWERIETAMESDWRLLPGP